jgi:hypothetical protein
MFRRLRGVIAKLWLHGSSKTMRVLLAHYHLIYFSYSKNVMRSRVVTSKLLSIEALNNHQSGQVFVEDIMVFYRTYLDKENKSRSIICADMTNKDAMMKVTLTVPPQLVQKHAEKIFPCNGISITKFNIFPKTVYDRGDCDRIISSNETSIVEKNIVVCSEYRFIWDSTISLLAESTDVYPIRTIGDSITQARKFVSQHILHIKDGELDNDKVMVPLFIFSFFLYFHIYMYVG